jgi:hypothetical protein
MLRALVAALALAVGAGGRGDAPMRPPEPAKVPRIVHGILWNNTGLSKPRLTKLKPLSLAPIGHPVPLRVGAGSATALSPDGSRLAIGTAHPGIQVIDPRRMKEVGFVKLGGIGWVTFLFWQGGTLFAVVSDDTHTTALVVDPRGEQVVQRHRLNRLFITAAESADGIVFLTSPRGGIGPVELTVLGGKGAESVAIDGISGGTETENDEEGFRAGQVVPGLAIDEEARRAYVVSAGRNVAEVSLSNLTVGYHELSEPVSLLGRLRNWLEPAAEAKMIEGPQRKAASLGNGLVLVTGVDYTTATGSNGEPRGHVEAAGLSLIDTSDWSIRELDDETSDFTLFESTLLAYGDTSWGDASQNGMGLRGYDLGGREIFHVLNRTRVGWIEASGDLAYVFVNDRRRIVVDAVSGRRLSRAEAPKSLSLVPG